MSNRSSPASDASSDLYAEADGSAPLDLVSRSRPRVASPASDDHMYDDSPVPTPVHSKGKRRLADTEELPQQQSVKKRKFAPEAYFSPVVPAVAGLPAEVWQQVFLYLTPYDLSRCLRVSQLFRSYLTELTATMSIRLPFRRTGLKLLDSESIWTSARKLYAANLPRPLAGFTEMHMFQLLGGKGCQECGYVADSHVPPSSPFDLGPGPDGVRIIWSFAARLCSRCFQTFSVKDVDVLVSPVAPLRAGLPYAFCTPDLHYIPATLQPQAATALKGTMFKVYSQKHIDDLQQEHQNAKEFGDAAAEEWVKGLPLLGKQQMADAARWERWEALLPLGKNIGKVLREYFGPCSAPVEEAPVAAVTAAAVPPVSATSLPAPPSTQMKHPLPARVVAAPSTAQSSTNGHSPQQTSKKEWRPPRNMKEVNEAKAIRRTEIERRCYEEFQPPLIPNVLQHMESFNAAMQITTPLTDSAWEVLKPRLNAQRDAAEQIEYMRQEQLRALQATIPDPAYQAMYSQTIDTTAAQRQYEAAQAPIRRKLGSYAEEFIRAKWNGGKSLSRENCPVFAVEVLLYARNKYIEVNKPSDVPSDRVTEESDPWFVALENMRWLFDTKVKTYTDKFCRELFHCSECKSLGKAYAFEGMIQHYGAKHTSDFSKGNIVVHWQSAEWPDESPLEPCNGVAPNPTLSSTPAPGKGKKSAEAIQYDTLNKATASSQPIHGVHPIQQGVAWPAAAYGHAQPEYPVTSMAYPPTTQPAYAHYGYPHAQPLNPADPYYQQAYYPPTTVAAPASKTNPKPLPGHDYQNQLEEVASVAREVWDSTSGVKGLEGSIKMQTILHHVVSRFKTKFGSEPSLDLLTDALANHVLMRPIKDASGMACKTCISSRLDGYLAFQPYAVRIADSKLYNISSLITHFKTVHLQSADDAGLDWKEDMIELPEDAGICDVMNAVGMNDDKLATIAAAFPKIFPTPLPRIGEVKASSKPAPVKETPARRRADKKKNKKQKRNSGHHPVSVAQGETSEEQSDALPEPADDEYDPRRPAFLEHGNQGSNLNQNGKRPHGDSQRQQPSIDLTQLAPETLEALSRLRPSDPEVQKALAGRTERSPSVPRADGAGSNPPGDTRRQNRAAFEANRLPNLATDIPRDANPRSNARNDRGGEVESPEDYTQIIRTPADGPYNQHAIAAPQAPFQEHYVRMGSHGQPIEQARHEPVPYSYDYGPRTGHPDYYHRPEYRMGHQPPPPVSYSYEPRPETVYVDQYGRPVEVVRVIERHQPLYEYPPHQAEYPPRQPEYIHRDDPHRRYVYYEQPPPPGPQPGYGGPQRVEYGQMHGGRYVYDDGRASVPRM